MLPAPVDPRSALDSANQSDLVQKKLSIDAMRKRVSGGPSEESKLRDACEGFESVFLQKMWEQMRKNVKKEGYLHSKDEEAYQSMFDVELAKKMASAGGIGLADMLYEQLGQKLHNASKATGAGSPRAPLPIEPARPPKPDPQEVAAAAAPPTDLYSNVVESPADMEPVKNLLETALEELAASRDPALDPANATYPMFDLPTGAPMNPVAGKIKEDSRPRQDIDVTPMPERVSAPGKAKPSNALRNINRSARHAKRNNAAENGAQAAEAAGQAQAAHAAAQVNPAPASASVPVTENAEPAATARPSGWPVRGDLISSYGRNGEGWNTGVAFTAAPASPVIAPMAGTVAFVGEKDGVALMALDHGDGLTSHYTNVVTTFAAGDEVLPGMEFAKVSAGAGSSAAQTPGTAGLVHFEVRRGELAINPESILG